MFMSSFCTLEEYAHRGRTCHRTTIFVDRMKTKVDQNDNTTIAFESCSLTHAHTLIRADKHARTHCGNCKVNLRFDVRTALSTPYSYTHSIRKTGNKRVLCLFVVASLILYRIFCQTEMSFCSSWDDCLHVKNSSIHSIQSYFVVNLKQWINWNRKIGKINK